MINQPSEELKPCKYCNDIKEIIIVSPQSITSCHYCKKEIIIKYESKYDYNTRTQPEVSVPTSIKFPEPKTWTEDKAMTVNPGSDNYKMGFNDALKLCEKAYEEAPKPEPSKEVTETVRTFDARTWAKSFNETLVILGYQPHDEGWLIGWFANAIMMGYDEAKRPKEVTESDGEK